MTTIHRIYEFRDDDGFYTKRAFVQAEAEFPNAEARLVRCDGGLVAVRVELEIRVADPKET